jgi:two-component system sensor histidine kinase/response regulator
MITLQKVLSVDDEPRNLRILQEILEGVCMLELATSGEEAWEKLQSFVPDLVLLDIMLPGIDGYEVCRRIRQDPRFCYTHVLLVSGKASMDEKLQGYDAGAHDYLTKPFEPAELMAKTKVFLRLSAMERALADVNQQLEEEVKLRSEQVIRAEKAAFLGMHAAEIVHNLNNPLTLMHMNLYFLQNQYPDEKRLGNIAKAIERMRDIIKSILLSTRGSGAEQIEDIQINDVLRNEIKLFEVDAFFKHEITTEMELSDLPSVRGQYVHFSQSFGNLIRNAVDALYKRDQKRLTLRSRLEGTNIVVEISDTGCGIAEEDLKRLFDPFFTTKPLVPKPGEPGGNGLGLPSVKRMIEAYKGHIQFTSILGVGTKVKVILPQQGEGRLSGETPSQAA